MIVDEQGGFNKNLGNDTALAQKLAKLILMKFMVWIDQLNFQSLSINECYAGARLPEVDPIS